MSSFEVRELVGSDLARVASVHIAAFPTSALTGLGKEAVRRYYEWLLVGPHQTTALVAVSKQEPVAFLFGGTFNGAMSGFLRRNRRYLAFRVAVRPWLVGSPLFRTRLISALRIVRRRSVAATVSTTPTAPQAFGILAIAVVPSAQGTGVARALMVRAEEISLQSGFKSMQLTVAASNERAIAFYLRSGWQKVLRDGEWTGAMTKALRTGSR